MPRSAWSSAQYAEQAYMPFFEPPVTPQAENIQGTSAVAQQGLPGNQWDQNARFVNRDPRRIGIRTLYSYGGRFNRFFRMIATGQVESSKFQPRTNHTWDGEFNDAIFQAGYPRNLGLTFKVKTVNPNINPPWNMLPRPDFKGRSIFVNRRPVTSGIPGVPATPTNGAYS